MNCSEYRLKFPALSELLLIGDDEEAPELSAWRDHDRQCIECSDWRLAQGIIRRGYDPDAFPCVHLADQVTQTCDQHPDPHDCPDVLIIYDPRFDEYSIPIRDGGSSSVPIAYCPWCGVRLPESKRDC